jgi:hypothetical protein
LSSKVHHPTPERTLASGISEALQAHLEPSRQLGARVSLALTLSQLQRTRGPSGHPSPPLAASESSCFVPKILHFRLLAASCFSLQVIRVRLLQPRSLPVSRSLSKDSSGHPSPPLAASESSCLLYLCLSIEACLQFLASGLLCDYLCLSIVTLHSICACL